MTMTTKATLNSCVMIDVAASSRRSWRGLCDLNANNQHLRSDLRYTLQCAVLPSSVCIISLP